MPRFSYQVCKKCDRLEKFINIWQSSQDHLKTGDFRMKREDGSCPIKTGGSCLNWESWNIFEDLRLLTICLNLLLLVLVVLSVRPRRLLIVHLLAISSAIYHCLSRKKETVSTYTSRNNKQIYFMNLYIIYFDSFSAW